MYFDPSSLALAETKYKRTRCEEKKGDKPYAVLSQ